MRLERAHGDVPAVLRLVDGVARVVSGEQGVAALRLLLVEQVAEGVDHLPRDRTVHHADVDELPLPGLLARPERREDADRGHQRAAADVGDLHARNGRRATGRAGEVDHAREAEIVDVVPDAIRDTDRPARTRRSSSRPGAG